MTNTPAKIDQHSGDLVGTTADRGTYTGGVSHYSTEQRDVLRALMNAGDASDGDLDMLAQVAGRAGLDPFAKEIYLVGRRTKVGGYKGEPERWETVWSAQVGIEGFRKATHRFAAEKGSPVKIEKPVFYHADGSQTPFWTKAMGEHPEACEVTIHVGDSEASAVCTWDEYVQTVKGGAPNSMWRKMGPTMLRKCAEAAAHRMITPITSGLYIAEEMPTEPVPATATRVDAPTRGTAGVKAALAQAPAEEERWMTDPLGYALDGIAAATTGDALDKITAWAGQQNLPQGDVDEVEAQAAQRGIELGLNQADQQKEEN
jgi:phage recombination protein Bet